MTSKIEQSYAQRLLQLPAETQLLVLAAAAEPLGDPVLLHRAAESLGIDAGRGRPCGRRRAAHGRCARRVRAPARPLRRLPRGRRPTTATACIARSPRRPTPRPIPDRRAWHRARATPGPDEEVAAELERSADRAQARGGLAAAAAFLTRAAELTPDPAQRVRAGAGCGAGQRAGGRVRHRAQPARHRARPARSTSCNARGSTCCVPAGVRLEPRQRCDTAAARSRPAPRATGRRSWRARPTWTRSRGPVRRTAQRGCRRARGGRRRSSGTAPGRRTSATAADLLLDALVALSDDYDTAMAPCRRRVAEALERRRSRRRNGCAGCGRAASSRLEVWDDESAYVLSRDERADRPARRARSASWRSRSARASRCSCSAASCRLRRRVDRGDAVGAGGDGHRAAPYGALDRSPRGAVRYARRNELIETTIREAGSRGEGIGLAICEYAAPSCATASASTTRRSVAASLRQRVSGGRRRELGPERADRAGHANRTNRSGDRGPESAGREGAGERNRLGARHRGPLTRPAERRRRRRATLPRGHRASGPDARARRARPRPPAVRGVAAARRIAGWTRAAS